MSCSNNICKEKHIVDACKEKLKRILKKEINLLKIKKRYIKLCLIKEQLKNVQASSNHIDILYEKLDNTENEITEAKKELSILNKGGDLKMLKERKIIKSDIKNLSLKLENSKVEEKYDGYR